MIYNKYDIKYDKIRYFIDKYPRIFSHFLRTKNCKKNIRK